jgi:hypothetical protein
LQYRNVIWQDGRIAAVFDWDRIRVRPYAEEVARTATIQFSHADGLDLRRVAALDTGYRTIVPLGGDDLADGVHRLWWKECRTAGSSWKRSSDVRRARFGLGVARSDEVGGPFGDHEGRCVGMAAGDPRHHRGVHYPQPVQAVDA